MTAEKEFFDEIRRHHQNLFELIKKYPKELKKYERFYREQLGTACDFETWNRFFAFPNAETIEEFILFYEVGEVLQQILLLIPKYFSPSSEIKMEISNYYSPQIIITFDVDEMEYKNYSSLTYEIYEELRKSWDYDRFGKFVITPYVKKMSYNEKE